MRVKSVLRKFVDKMALRSGKGDIGSRTALAHIRQETTKQQELDILPTPKRSGSPGSDFMILNDQQIRELVEEQGMIDPFHRGLVSSTDEGPVISFGLSSFGYDIRLSPKDFRIFRHLPGQVVDPKHFNPNHVERAELIEEDQNSKYFILPGNSYSLGVAIERLNVPKNTSVLAIGKSTYARCGLIANVTPAEPGWRGHLTLEFSNSSPADCRIYANEGVIQLLFLRGEYAGTCYNARSGKYQDQKLEVTLPRVLRRLAQSGSAVGGPQMAR